MEAYRAISCRTIVAGHSLSSGLWRTVPYGVAPAICPPSEPGPQMGLLRPRVATIKKYRLTTARLGGSDPC